MILAYAKVLIQHKYNPAQKLWAQAIDISHIAFLMSYVQLSLWNIPAEVIHGDSLALDFYDIWYTPAYALHNWKDKLAHRKQQDISKDKLENINANQNNDSAHNSEEMDNDAFGAIIDAFIEPEASQSDVKTSEQIVPATPNNKISNSKPKKSKVEPTQFSFDF